jgi:hypothetical protein
MVTDCFFRVRLSVWCPQTGQQQTFASLTISLPVPFVCPFPHCGVSNRLRLDRERR